MEATKVFNKTLLFNQKDWEQMKKRALAAKFYRAQFGQPLYSVNIKSGYREIFTEKWIGYKDGVRCVVNLRFIGWRWGSDKEIYTEIPQWDGMVA